MATVKLWLCHSLQRPGMLISNLEVANNNGNHQFGRLFVRSCHRHDLQSNEQFQSMMNVRSDDKNSRTYKSATQQKFNSSNADGSKNNIR